MREFPPVMKSALWLAGARVLESRRKRPLMNDTFAAQLLGAEGLKVALELERQHPAPRAILRRTRLMDELLKRYIKDRGVQVVVVAGTGLDARPYRLDWPPALKWIELDYPVVTEWKNARLQSIPAHCVVERVGADLTRPGSLVTAVGDSCRGQKTLVLMENLLHYFSMQDTLMLFREFSCFSQGAIAIADLPSSSFAKSGLGRRMLAELETKNVAGRTAIDDSSGFAQSLGFKLIESYPLACLGDDPALWPTAKCPWWAPKSRADLIRVAVMEKI